MQHGNLDMMTGQSTRSEPTQSGQWLLWELLLTITPKATLLQTERNYGETEIVRHRSKQTFPRVSHAR